MKKIKIVAGLGALALMVIGSQVFGQVAEAPFYTQKRARPNVMLLLDNSGSMISNKIDVEGVLKTRLDILKIVLTGDGQLQYKTTDNDPVYIAHGDTTTIGGHWVLDDLMASRVHVYRVRWDTYGTDHYDAYKGGPYFVFYSQYDAQHPDTDVTNALTFLDAYAREEATTCFHRRATANVANDSTGSGNRDIWEPSSTSPCPSGLDYMSFGGAFRKYYRYEETGTLFGGTVYVVPVYNVPPSSSAIWWDPSSHLIPQWRTGLCYYVRDPWNQRGWKECYKPIASSDLIVFYADLGVTDADTIESKKMTLAAWAAANGNATHICKVDEMEVWGDGRYDLWYFDTSGRARDDGNIGVRNIYTKCDEGTAGAIPTSATIDDATIKAEMGADLPNVTAVDVVPQPDNIFGPEFIFDTEGYTRIDDYIWQKIGLDPLTFDDIDLDDPKGGIFFEHLYYDDAKYEDQGIMDRYPDVNYGLMVYDNTTTYKVGNYTEDQESPSCTDDDFPADASSMCVGAKLIWNLDGWADFPAYKETNSVDQLNLDLQTMINSGAIDPPGSGALTPIAAAFHDAYRYFYDDLWSGWDTTQRPKDKLLTSITTNNHNMFYDLSWPIASGSLDEIEHIVQDDPYFHTGDSSVKPCRRNFLIFLTDGDQTQGENKNNAITWTSRLANDGGGLEPSLTGVKTYVIGFQGVSDAGQILLTDIAEASEMSDVEDDIITFFFADNKPQLLQSFSIIMNAIMQGSYARTAPKVSTYDNAGITSYFDVRLDRPLWEGHLMSWQLEPLPGNTAFNWQDIDAAVTLNSNHNRNLFFAVGDNPLYVLDDPSSSKKKDFDPTHILALDPQPFNPIYNAYTNTVIEKTVELIRHDTGATFASGDTVPWALGPNFHSQPQLVGPPRSTEYSLMPYYSDFVTANANRPKLIYMGTGYGVLHAFDSKTGKEAFGYVPQGEMKSLVNLYNGLQIYGVDGSPVVDDVFGDFDYDTDTPDVWRSVLMVGLGGGGTAYVAMDVTDATTTDDTGVEPLWNFHDQQLGFAWSVPVRDFIKYPDQDHQKNVAFFGGGLSPGNTSDVSGSFYIIDSVNGDLLKVFDLWDKDQINNTDFNDDLDVDTSVKNWNQVPGSPSIIDADQDGFYDWAYVGDNQGRVWKMNFHDPDPATWTQCLFYDVTDTDVDGIPDEETRRQPIWYTPILVNGPNEMLFVYFSTGHIETGDASQSDSDIYRLYALLDNQPAAAAGCQYASTIRESLTGDSDRWPRAFDPGEKLIASPTVTQSLLIFQTWVPNSGIACSEGQMRLWIVDYLSGGTVWDFDHDGTTEQFTVMPNTGTLAIDDRGGIWTTCLSDDCKGEIQGQGSLGTPPPYAMSWGEGIELPF
ncbi:MAG TPA: PilC/PilY family type IV pilus protein [bacterium]|nr:PilC/PilY family type IV pilus protein [bacterium]